MANKWRTTVTEANAVFVNYGVHPSDLSTEALTRKWTGIDRSVLYSLITTIRGTKTVTDPYADGQKYSGTWTVDTVDPVLDEGGNLAGSATIVQVLKKNVYAYAEPDNVTTARSRAYPLEQDENAWMYYERFKNEITSRWHNLTYAGLIDEVWDGVRQIRNATDFNSAVLADDDKVVNVTWKYYHRKFLYDIIYIDALPFTPHIGAAPHGGFAEGKYYIPDTAVWSAPYGYAETSTSWFFDHWVEVTDPIIREVWYEQNTDGTYDLFRSLETTSEPAIMRTRALQYAGMTLLQGYPMLDDTVLTIAGLNNTTETVYANARLRIGSDTYRVLDNSTAVAGQVTVNVNPAITQATEDAADENPNATQVLWNAL